LDEGVGEEARRKIGVGSGWIFGFVEHDSAPAVNAVLYKPQAISYDLISGWHETSIRD
jgi:hypothetical protein